MIDFARVRAYYFAPPPPDPLSIPSDEELIARYERRRVERCILRLGDPAAEALGPHGSMIGGPGLPITIHYERAERTTPLVPLPLSCWDHPRARLRLLPPGGHPAALSYLRDLAGAHLAGVPNRPSAQDLAFMFRSPQRSRSPTGRDKSMVCRPWPLAAADREVLRQLLAALPAPRFKSLRTLGSITLYEMARAVHLTGNRRNAFIRWLHRFAVLPKPPANPL